MRTEATAAPGKHDVSAGVFTLGQDAASIDLQSLIGPLRDTNQTAILVTTEDCSGTPDHRGVLRDYVLHLPAHGRAAYFAGAQRHGIDPARVTWPDGCNQLQPLVYDAGNDPLRDLKEGGLMLVAELDDGSVLAVLPIAGRQTVAWMGSDPYDLTVRVGTLGTADYQGAADILAVGVGACPASACDRAWRAAMEAPSVRGRLRHRLDKQWPSVFDTLGWCSWESFRADITDRSITRSFTDIGRSEIPIRWAIIDDGWLDGLSLRFTDPRQCDDRALLSFEPHAERFPEGFEVCLHAARQAGIEHVGLWLNFNGYWEGLHSTHRIDHLKDNLSEVRPDAYLPAPNERSSRKFYESMLQNAVEFGFDLVKVDNQAKNLDFYRGAAPNAQEAAARNSASLESGAAQRFDAMINCMAHNSTCVFSSEWSAVTRCSEDYLKGDAWRAKMHIYHSFANMLYFGSTVWGDHDMFHSSDTMAGEMMARSKAISGGPVYLSDEPDAFKSDVIWPLVYSDGRVLRPLAPATPLPESVFTNPYTEGKAFRVIAPLPGGVAAVCGFNLTEPGIGVTAHVSPDDYLHAGTLTATRGPWTLPGEGLWLYDRTHNLARPLDGEGYHRDLAPLCDLFTLLIPVRCGWVVLGAIDKHLSTAACEVRIASERELVVRVQDSLDVTVIDTVDEPRCVVGTPVDPAAHGEGVRTYSPDANGIVRLIRP